MVGKDADAVPGFKVEPGVLECGSEPRQGIASGDDSKPADVSIGIECREGIAVSALESRPESESFRVLREDRNDRVGPSDGRQSGNQGDRILQVHEDPVTDDYVERSLAEDSWSLFASSRD